MSSHADALLAAAEVLEQLADDHDAAAERARLSSPPPALTELDRPTFASPARLAEQELISLQQGALGGWTSGGPDSIPLPALDDRVWRAQAVADGAARWRASHRREAEGCASWHETARSLWSEHHAVGAAYAHQVATDAAQLSSQVAHSYVRALNDAEAYDEVLADLDLHRAGLLAALQRSLARPVRSGEPHSGTHRDHVAAVLCTFRAPCPSGLLRRLVPALRGVELRRESYGTLRANERSRVTSAVAAGRREPNAYRDGGVWLSGAWTADGPAHGWWQAARHDGLAYIEPVAATRLAALRLVELSLHPPESVVDEAELLELAVEHACELGRWLPPTGGVSATRSWLLSVRRAWRSRPLEPAFDLASPVRDPAARVLGPAADPTPPPGGPHA